MSLVGRHKATLDETALAQIFAPDGVGRHEHIAGLGLETVSRRTQKAKALFGNFQVTLAFFGPFGPVVFSHYKWFSNDTLTGFRLYQDNLTGIASRNESERRCEPAVFRTKLVALANPF